MKYKYCSAVGKVKLILKTKEALTAEELASREPEEPELIQMTDARCKRCAEKKVRLMEIIQAGHGDRYSREWKTVYYDSSCLLHPKLFIVD
ncbi:hypothetical protein T459_35493 [Capsicum annuum]|uniref:TFIIS central domain-containing protein n=1 Tax=Capsicum annuum TaxID=4072 RepID=A0A2G2XJ72_CAPAN|nr:hypothetical protein T459_35493 [Capsicum annuum]